MLANSLIKETAKKWLGLKKTSIDIVDMIPIVCKKGEVTKLTDNFTKEANIDPIIVRAVAFCLFAKKVINFVEIRDELAPALIASKSTAKNLFMDCTTMKIKLINLCGRIPNPETYLRGKVFLNGSHYTKDVLNGFNKATVRFFCNIREVANDLSLDFVSKIAQKYAGHTDMSEEEIQAKRDAQR